MVVVYIVGESIRLIAEKNREMSLRWLLTFEHMSLILLPNINYRAIISLKGDGIPFLYHERALDKYNELVYKIMFLTDQFLYGKIC